MIKAVIFDMWDTIIPSTVDFAALAKVAKMEHIPLKEFVHRYENAVQLKRYKSVSELHKDFLVEFKCLPRELLEEEFKEVYLQREKDISFFPESRGVLLSLKNEGYKIGLLSNTENLLTGKIEAMLHLSKIFDSVCYSFEIHAIKPDKVAFECILSKLKVKPEEALMVGDSMRADMCGSAGMHMHNCLINRSGKKVDYSMVKPEFEIKSLKELKDVLGELNAKKDN